MKKITNFILAIVCITSFIACNDSADTENISRITHYVSFNILGADFSKFSDGPLEIVDQGSDYTEKGVEAFEGENDVTATVITSGTVDTTTPGLYTISYSATNKDGFDSSAIRNVLVVPTSAKNDIDISGEYSSNVRRAKVTQGSTITKIATGVFRASDFMGGYYSGPENEGARGFGSNYRAVTYFYINPDNTYTTINGHVAPWNDTWVTIGGVYDPITKTLNHRGEFSDGFGFDVSLIFTE